MQLTGGGGGAADVAATAAISVVSVCVYVHV